MKLELVPVRKGTADAAIRRWHRHHMPSPGLVFAVGVACDGELVGVVTVGRPVARAFDDGDTLEVTRCATDGTPHAASMLYGAAWRAARALGYRRLVTYTEASEPGTSLRAAGWRVLAERPPRAGWSTMARPRDDRLYRPVARTLWEAV